MSVALSRTSERARPRRAPAWVYALAALAALVGAVALAAGLLAPDPAPAWRALLVNALYWASLGFGAFLWAAIFRVTRAAWSAPINRMAHAVLWFLPVPVLALLALYFGRADLLPWLHLPRGDRAVWLNLPLLFARTGLGLLALFLLAWWFVRTYRRGERATDAVQADRRLSVLGVALLFVYGLVFSLLGFDWVMSLAPFWISTLFGWYFTVGSLYEGIAALVLMAVLLRGWLGVRVALGPPRLLDLGNLLLAMALALTSMFFSQALPIWYENLPFEAPFAIVRLHLQPWRALFWVTVFTAYLGVFVLPIVREIKTRPVTLGSVAGLALASLWLERYVLVEPSLAPRHSQFPWLGVLVFVGFLGAFVLTVTPALARQPAESPLDLALAAGREEWQ